LTTKAVTIEEEGLSLACRMGLDAHCAWKKDAGLAARFLHMTVNAALQEEFKIVNLV